MSSEMCTMYTLHAAFLFRTIPRTLVILASIWVVNAVCLSPVAVISRLQSYWDFGATHHFCVETFETPLQSRLFTLSLFLFYYVVPLCVIGMSYFLMAKNLWHSVSPSFLQDNTVKALKSRRRVSKMVLVLVLVFAVCWLPIHSVHLYNDFGEPGNHVTLYIVTILAHFLSYANSALNPIIYSFMSENFRKCCKVAFAGCQCRKSGEKRVFVVVDPEAIPAAQPLPRIPRATADADGNNQRSNVIPLRVSLAKANQAKVHTRVATREELL